MKLFKIFSRFLALAVVALWAAGCATILHDKENLASAAGFRPVTPKTAHQQQLLATLPEAKVTRVTWKHKMYYVLPDAKHDVAYIGGQKEYQQYRKLRLQERLSNESLEAAALNENASLNWGWGGWGGWDGVGPMGFWYY